MIVPDDDSHAEGDEMDVVVAAAAEKVGLAVALLVVVVVAAAADDDEHSQTQTFWKTTTADVEHCHYHSERGAAILALPLHDSSFDVVFGVRVCDSSPSARCREHWSYYYSIPGSWTRRGYWIRSCFVACGLDWSGSRRFPDWDFAGTRSRRWNPLLVVGEDGGGGADYSGGCVYAPLREQWDVN